MALVLNSKSRQDIANKTIPLIKNVLPSPDPKIKDKDRQILPSLPSVNLPKIFKLLTDKHSRNLFERHKNALRRLTSSYRDGIPLKDVFSVAQILKICSEYLKQQQEYEDCICNILQCFRKPFWKENVSDEDCFLSQVVNCLNDLGEIAVHCSSNIQKETAIVVDLLYNQGTRKCESHDFQPVSPDFLKAAIERSRVCRSLVECYAIVNDFGPRLELIRALRQLSTSRLNCDDMLSANAASLLCNSLLESDPSGRLVFLSVEVLWNLFEFGSAEEVSNQLNCDECINALQVTFVDRLKNCSGHADRQLRNDLLVLCIVVAVRCPEAPFVASGFAKTLSLLASYPEVKSNSEIAKSMKLQSNHEDFELKKLLFNMMVVLSKDSASISVMSQQRVVLALFSYIQPIQAGLKTIWSPAQFEELQLQALSVLSTIAPLCIDDYMTCQGNTRLLLLLEWCIGIDDYGGHGNSFHATGGRGNKRAQMRYCIRLIRSVCAHGDEQVIADLTDQNAIGELIGILQNASTSSDENDAIDIEMQCDMLFILASICDGDAHRKELFGESGVQMLINYLNINPQRILSPLGHHRLMLATVDCVWSAILGCFVNEIIFLEKEGVFLLLDLLEVCPENMQNLVLGATLDLCENPRAIPHVKLWRGKNDSTVGQLLLSLWKSEEKSLGINRDPSGLILDPNKPIMSNIQESQGIISLPSSFPSPAVVDVSENIRAKIFSMFCKIGFNNVPGLTTSDYITLSVIERYLEFKTLEVWIEIRSELDQERIRPVTPDRDYINTIIETLEERAITVSSVQRMLVDADSNNSLLEEEEYFDKIKESHKQEEKQFLDFTHFVERTSDFSALQKAREKQLEAIERSRLKSRTSTKGDEISHETTDTQLRTTTFCGRSINVESTPAEVTKSFSHENNLLKDF